MANYISIATTPVNFNKLPLEKQLAYEEYNIGVPNNESPIDTEKLADVILEIVKLYPNEEEQENLKEIILNEKRIIARLKNVSNTEAKQEYEKFYNLQLEIQRKTELDPEVIKRYISIFLGLEIDDNSRVGETKGLRKILIEGVRNAKARAKAKARAEDYRIIGEKIKALPPGPGYNYNTRVNANGKKVVYVNGMPVNLTPTRKSRKTRRRKSRKAIR